MSSVVISPPRSRATAVVPPPTRADREALARAAAYLYRAGTTVASRLLAAPDDPLLIAVRDTLLASADLCDGLIDLPKDESASVW